MGEALGKGGPIDAVSLLEIAVTDPHMGLRCLPWYVQVWYMSFLAVGGLVFWVASGWQALVGVPGDLSWWVVSQRNIDSILVAWLDLCWFSLFLF